MNKIVVQERGSCTNDGKNRFDAMQDNTLCLVWLEGNCTSWAAETWPDDWFPSLLSANYAIKVQNSGKAAIIH